MMSEKVVRRSLVDQVHLFLVQRIQNRSLQPGERLNIEELAREFDVSRTPVREAISRLMDLAPKTAHVVREGVETEIPVEEVQVDDSGASSYAILAPEANFDALTEVFVIKSFEIVT